jgi:hypothetical protein
VDRALSGELLTETEIQRARVLVAQIGDAFAHYVNGEGYAVNELLKLAPRFFDEVAAFRGYDKEFDAAGLRTGKLVDALEADRDALRAEVERLRAGLLPASDLPDHVRRRRARLEAGLAVAVGERDIAQAEVERLRNAYDGSRANRREENATAQADRDALRAAVEAGKRFAGEIQVKALDELIPLRAERDALRAEVERLRPVYDVAQLWFKVHGENPGIHPHPRCRDIDSQLGRAVDAALASEAKEPCRDRGCLAPRNQNGRCVVHGDSLTSEAKATK